MAQSKFCCISSLAGYALSGARAPRCVGQQRGPEWGAKQHDPRPGWSCAPLSGDSQMFSTVEGSSGELKLQYPRPGGSRAARSENAQLSWTAELAQLSEKARNVS